MRATIREFYHVRLRQWLKTPFRSFLCLFAGVAFVYGAMALLFFLIGLISPRLGAYLMQEVRFSSLFFLSFDDLFMDFFNSVRDAAQGLAAYTERRIIYPPLANLFYCAVALLFPDAYCNSVFDDRLQAFEIPFCIAFIVGLSILSLVALCAACRGYLKGEGKYWRWGFLFSVIFLFPVMYVIERGNILLLCGICLLMFVLWYRESGWKREAALVFLAIACGLKFYPAVFALLLVAERRIFETVRAALYSVFLVIVPSFFMGGPIRVIEALVKNIVAFAQLRQLPSDLSMLYINLLTSVQQACRMIWGDNGFFLPLGLTLFLIALPVAFFIVCFFLTKELHKRCLALAGVMLCVPGVASMHALVMLLPAFLVFLRDVRTWRDGMDKIYFLYYALTFIPLPFIMPTGWSASVIFASCLSFWALFILLFVDVLIIEKGLLRRPRKETVV